MSSSQRVHSLVFIVALAIGSSFGLSSTLGCSRGAPHATALAGAREPITPPRSKLSREDLAAHRKLQIERLHAYAEAGVFPRNPSRSPEPVHMFRDADGRLCAVANLIHLDGLDAEVDRMAKEHNDIVVADEPSGALHDWVLTSGLTHEEVRRIQGAGFFGEPMIVDGPALERQKTALLQLHLRAVEGELIAASEGSLDVAMQRLDARGAGKVVQN